jgi:putative component of toxin-antitoxin plasmid stabilization module
MSEWELVFYEDDDGSEPVLDWLLKLDAYKRRAAAAALESILANQGIDVCRSGWGRWVKGVDGIFELRIRQDYGTIMRNAGVPVPAEHEAAADERHGDVLLRIFCHAHGRKVVLLLAGYDKGEDPSPRRQNKEAKRAERCLERWKRRQRAAAKSSKRTQGRGKGNRTS